MNSASFVGNLTADPKLIFGNSGKARATFSVAVNEGQGEDEKTHFVNVTAFGTLAENLADSLSKGQRVLVIGRLNTYSKDVTIDGDDKSLTMVSFTASAIGPDLRWATAKVTKVVREGNAAADVDAGSAPAKQSAKSSSTRQPAKQSAANDDDDF
jgi:single-strand DNA-binding protein